ncbi:hypothetical protein Ddc_20638 [Ditylenchus destructor]|nr:hypothetical protein Ddc_20638 [Ditylenchus destructor]
MAANAAQNGLDLAQVKQENENGDGDAIITEDGIETVAMPNLTLNGNLSKQPTPTSQNIINSMMETNFSNQSTSLRKRRLPDNIANDLAESPKKRQMSAMKCHLCQISLPNIDEMEIHISAVHHRFFPYNCLHCLNRESRCFATEKQVLQHSKNDHPGFINFENMLLHFEVFRCEKVKVQASVAECVSRNIHPENTNNLNQSCRKRSKSVATVSMQQSNASNGSYLKENHHPEIMDRQNVLRRAVKRRQANSSPGQNREKMNMPRKSVNVPDDTWFDAFKFLTCPQWMQKRFVSRQINGIAQRNISRLPKMVIDSATMYYTNPPGIKKHTIIAFDTAMHEKYSKQWFKERGFALDAPADIPAENALIGVKEWQYNVNVCIHKPAAKKISLELKRLCCWFNSSQIYRKPVLFCAQFNPALNQYSWNYLAFFLVCIFHPTLYVKEVKMFAVNQNFIDSLKCNIDSLDNDPHYIRCESFSLERVLYGAGTQIRFHV